MAKTRVIIEGEGVTPFPKSLLGCSHNGAVGVAAWIGLELRERSEDGNFPWQDLDYKSKQECGLFPETGLITVRVEHDGKLESKFTCPVHYLGEWPVEEDD